MNQSISPESLWDSIPAGRETFSTEIKTVNTYFAESSSKSASTGQLTLKDTQTERRTESEHLNLIELDVSNFRNLHKGKYSNVKAHVLQKWVGSVIFLDDENTEFKAFIRDKTDPEMPDEEVTIRYDELSTYDYGRLVPGAIFYWTIGYRLTGETKSKYSEIHFQRLILSTNSTIQDDEGLQDFKALFENVD